MLISERELTNPNLDRLNLRFTPMVETYGLKIQPVILLLTSISVVFIRTQLILTHPILDWLNFTHPNFGVSTSCFHMATV